MVNTVFVGTYNYSRNCPESKAFLEAHGFRVIENEYQRPYTREELLGIIGDLDAAITGMDIWDADLIGRAPKLKSIAKFGIGVDTIDIAAASARGIRVSNAQASTNAVAELVVGFMVALTRSMILGDSVGKAGRWDRLVGSEIRGKTIGLVGFGKIPRLVAKKLQGFEANILAYDLWPDSQAAATLGVSLVGLEELLASSDIVSLHLPVTPETRKSVGKDFFASMKHGAFFINTARGALVDEAALYQALASGKLAAAAQDVFDPEPPEASNPLFSLENFICTPHWGSDTIETIRLVGSITAKATVDAVCLDIDPENCLNRDEFVRG